MSKRSMVKGASGPTSEPTRAASRESERAWPNNLPIWRPSHRAASPDPFRKASQVSWQLPEELARFGPVEIFWTTRQS